MRLDLNRTDQSSFTHDQAVASLAQHLRSPVKPPLVWTEIAISGSWGSAGRFDLLALWIRSGYDLEFLYGYEVKGTRSDLLSDLRSEKWRKYLEQPIRRFYFACDHSIVDVSEIPDPAGLICYRPEKQTWRTLKKPGELKDAPELSTNALGRLLMRQHETYKRLEAQNRDRRLAEWAERLDFEAKADDANSRLAWSINGRVKDRIREILRRESDVEHREILLAEELEDLGVRMWLGALTGKPVKESWRSRDRRARLAT